MCTSLMKPQGKYRLKAINILLSLTVIAIGLLVCEGILRLVLNPSDYLRATIVKDDFLGFVIKPHSRGYDAWGFRNPSVPASADLVTLGDSHTFSLNARCAEAWPEVLERLTQKNVYNMGLSGFGPVQYYYLLKTKALQLQPALILVGFYLGNDLANVRHLVHSNPNWNYLKKTAYNSDSIRDLTLDPTEEAPSLKTWLGQNSLFYRLCEGFLGEAGANFLHRLNLGGNSGKRNIRLNRLNVRIESIPKSALRAIDFNDPRNQESLAISLDLFKEMNRICLASKIQLVVVLIPTKERVYLPYYLLDNAGDDYDKLFQIINYERQLCDSVKKTFQEEGILYLDLVDSLSAAAASIDVYPSTTDSHPNSAGYEIMARAIAAYLVSNHLLKP